jgi:hypothetical protein
MESNIVEVVTSCDTTLDRHFQSGPLSQLQPEQIAFMVAFIRNEGKINRVGEELGRLPPTVRGRLHDLIRILGYDRRRGRSPARGRTALDSGFLEQG